MAKTEFAKSTKLDDFDGRYTWAIEILQDEFAHITTKRFGYNKGFAIYVKGHILILEHDGDCGSLSFLAGYSANELSDKEEKLKGWIKWLKDFLQNN